MKKTISVNIKGMQFILEEDAYNTLFAYLNKLKERLIHEASSKEIIDDIELRIAELFQEKLSDRKEVIDEDDVSEVLSALGDPDDYIEDSDTERTNSAPIEENSSRHLYRDMDNAVIAGVCSGLANYFTIDVVIVRVIFVLFFFFGGFGFPLYVIMWIIVPKAITTIEKLRMKGQPVTVESVKQEIENAANRVSEHGKNFSKRIRSERNVQHGFSTLGRIISVFLGLFFLFGGVSLSIIFLIFGFTIFEFSPVDSDLGPISLWNLGDLIFEGRSDAQYAYLGATLVALSMILFSFLLGAKLLFRIRSRWSNITLGSFFGLGILGLIISIYAGIRIGTYYQQQEEVITEIQAINTDELKLEITKSAYHKYAEDPDDSFRIENDSVYQYGVEISFKSSPDSLFHLYQRNEAHGLNKKMAENKAKNIHYTSRIINNNLQLSNHYSYPVKDKIRGQHVELILEVPQGKQVKIGDQYILDEKNINSTLFNFSSAFINSGGEFSIN